MSDPVKELVQKHEGHLLKQKITELDGNELKFRFYLLTNEDKQDKSELHKQSPLLIGDPMIQKGKAPFEKNSDFKPFKGKCRREKLEGEETVIFFTKVPVDFHTTQVLGKKVKLNGHAGKVLITARPDMTDDDAADATTPASAAAPAAAPTAAPPAAAWTAAKTPTVAPAGASPAQLQRAATNLHARIDDQQVKLVSVTQTRENSEYLAGRAVENLREAERLANERLAKYDLEHPDDPDGIEKDPEFTKLRDAYMDAARQAEQAHTEAERWKLEEQKALEKLTAEEENLSKVLSAKAKNDWPADATKNHAEAKQEAATAKQDADRYAEQAQKNDEMLQRARMPALARAKIEAADAQIRKLTADRALLEKAANEKSHLGRKKVKGRRAAARDELMEIDQDLAKAVEERRLARELLAKSEELLKSKPPGFSIDELEQKKYHAGILAATERSKERRHELHAAQVAGKAAETQRTEAESRYAKALTEASGNLFWAQESLDTALGTLSEKKQAVDLFYLLGQTPGGPDQVLKGAEVQRARLEQQHQFARDEADKAVKDIQARLATASPLEKQELTEQLRAHQEEVAGCKAALEVQQQVVDMIKTTKTQVEAQGVGKLLDIQGAAAKEVGDRVTQLDVLKAKRTEQKDYLEWLRVKNLPEPLGSKDQKIKEKFRDIEKEIETAEAEVRKAQQILKLARDSVTSCCDKASASAKQELDLAAKTAQESQKQLELAQAGEKMLVERDPQLQALKQDYEDARIVDERARAEQIAAQAGFDQAEKDRHLAEFYNNISVVKEKYKDTFKNLNHLTDDTFDDVFEKNGKKKAAELYDLLRNKMVEKPDGTVELVPNPDWEKDVQNAHQAFKELVKQDAILRDRGASFEERKRAFDGVPEPLQPPEFREELKAYREVTFALAKEEDLERRKAVAKANFMKHMAGMVKIPWSVAGPLLDMLFEAIAISGDALDAFGPSGMNDLTQSGTAMAQNFGLFAAIADAVSAYGIDPVKEGVEDGTEMGKAPSTGDQTEALLTFVAGTLKVGLGAANAGVGIASNVLDLSSTASGVLGAVAPGLDIAIDAINLGLHTYKAGRAIHLAAKEGSLKSKVNRGEDEIMKKSFKNATADSRNEAIKKSIIAGGQAVKAGGSVVRTVGTIVGSAAYGGGAVIGFAAGTAIHLTGTGIVYGTKASFKVVDWVQAAKAKETMEKAAAGSQRAMQEVFRDHRKFATMYILLRARDGDRNCLALCVGRGLDKGELLDAKSSLMTLREQFVERVDKSDDPKTFKETVLKPWDALCKGGRLVKRKVMKPKKDSGPPGAMFTKSSNPEQVAKMAQQAREIYQRIKQDPDSYTREDAEFRTTALNLGDDILQLQASDDAGFKNKYPNNHEQLLKDARAIQVIMIKLPDHISDKEIQAQPHEFSTVEQMLRRRA